MTRFNITALQEHGMTPEEINAYIAERERAMYGGPRNSGAPTTQSESFDTKEATFTATPPIKKASKYLIKAFSKESDSPSIIESKTSSFSSAATSDAPSNPKPLANSLRISLNFSSTASLPPDLYKF